VEKGRDGQDYRTKISIAWAEALEVHIFKANGFVAIPERKLFNEDTGVLYSYVAAKQSSKDVYITTVSDYTS
jgi:hypothetical protein